MPGRMHEYDDETGSPLRRVREGGAVAVMTDLVSRGVVVNAQTDCTGTVLLTIFIQNHLDWKLM